VKENKKNEGDDTKSVWGLGGIGVSGQNNWDCPYKGGGGQAKESKGLKHGTKTNKKGKK